MDWRFVGLVPERQNFKIQGVDVWSQDWIPVKNEFAYVKDPSYHQPFRFQVYTIHSGGVVIRFAAGEFSVSMWGFYIKAEY
jgi:hypothetical protein